MMERLVLVWRGALRAGRIIERGLRDVPEQQRCPLHRAAELRVNGSFNDVLRVHCVSFIFLRARVIHVVEVGVLREAVLPRIEHGLGFGALRHASQLVDDPALLQSRAFERSDDGLDRGGGAIELADLLELFSQRVLLEAIIGDVRTKL